MEVVELEVDVELVEVEAVEVELVDAFGPVDTGVDTLAGATAAPAVAPGAGWRGSSDTIEFSSMVTEPLTRPPVSGP